MKLRNFIIVLLAVLMAFAFASCKNDPTPPGPTPPGPGPSGDAYQIEITEGVDKDYWNRDKLKLVWGEPVDEGDVITLKYRSERGIYQWDIRDENSKVKWVYESSKNGFVDPVLGDDGWYTLTYTFPANDINGAAVDYDAIQQFGIYFRANFVTTDLFEIKDITLNGYPLEVEAETIISKAKLNEEPVEHDWTKKNWAVLFATGTPGSVDKTPIAEKVLDGGFVTGAPVAKEGYTLTIYNDTAHTSIFDPTTPITEEKIFYYEYVGIPRTVKFETNGGSAIDDVEVANGDMLVAPEAPTKEGVAFKAWYKEAELVNPWIFTDPVLGDMTLYAQYGEPMTVTFDLNGGSFPEGVSNVKIVAKGNPVDYPADTPTNGSKMFLGWYADEELKTEYVFSTPIEADTTIYAGWVEATKVTLIDGDTATVIEVPLDVPMDPPAVVDDQIGYVFAGWFDDAKLTTKHDFSPAVTGEFTIYAGWEEATLYHMVSEHATAESYDGYDKFAIDFAVPAKAEDVLSFRYRSTAPISFYNVRNGSTKWIYQQPKDSPLPECFVVAEGTDGWTYVTYTFTAKNYDGTSDIPAQEKFSLHFGSKDFVVGDVLEVQDIVMAGKSLTLSVKSEGGELIPGDGKVGTNASFATIIEGGSYAWDDLDVTFVTGEHAGAIDPVTVKFGSTIEAPEVKTAEGYTFGGWYADELLTKEYNFALPIIEDTTIYARIGEAVTVTFDTNGGSDIDPAVIIKGDKVAKPADPENSGYVFGGWFKENTFENVYNFEDAVYSDTTIYAEWISSVKLSLYLDEAKTILYTVLNVEKDVAIDVPNNPAIPGSYFVKWVDEEGKDFDFSAGIDADTSVVATWTEPTTYIKLTSTEEQKRFTVRYKSNVISPEEGDVIAFKYRPHDGTFKYLNLRNQDSSDTSAFAKDTNIKDAGYSSKEPDEDGWYTFYFEFPENYKSGAAASYPYAGFIMEMIDSGKWQVGDSLDILGFSYNGEALEISATDNTKGLYDNGSYAKPTLAYYYVADDTPVPVV